MLLSIALPLSLCATASWAQEKVTKYTYDSLGRLTFVEDDVNGNRDYDYDDAGNRLQVSVTGGTDPGAEPPPQIIPGPTVTFVHQKSPCSWRTVWQPVADVTRYIVRDYSGEIEQEFTGTEAIYSFCSVWVLRGLARLSAEVDSGLERNRLRLACGVALI